MEIRMDIHELYRTAGKLHGHECPGLAIGVRAAAEAQKALKADGGQGLCCLLERSACWTDGIQSVLGATVGNGKLKLRMTGKPVFNFYNTESGETLRLYLRPSPSSLGKDQFIAYYLSAPVEEVFVIAKAFVPFPAAVPRVKEICCPVCGEQVLENMLLTQNGRQMCRDCAEKPYL